MKIFGFLKTNIYGKSAGFEVPADLIRYCARQGLPALLPYAIIDHMAHSFVNLREQSEGSCATYQRVFNYLLAYLEWVGSKSGKIDFSIEEQSKRLLALLPKGRFSQVLTSVWAVKRIEGCLADSRHVENVYRAYGASFVSDVPSKDLMETMWSGMLHTWKIKEWNLTEENFARAFVKTMNQHMTLPLGFYQEDPVAREWFNFGIIAELVVTTWKKERWEDWRDWPRVYTALTIAVQTLRNHIDESTFTAA